MKRVHFFENGINVVFEVDSDKKIRLIHFSDKPLTAEHDFSTDLIPPLVQLKLCKADGEVLDISDRLRFAGMTDSGNQTGRIIEVTQHDEQTGVEVISHFQFQTGKPVVEIWLAVRNNGDEPVDIVGLGVSVPNIQQTEQIQPQSITLQIGEVHNTQPCVLSCGISGFSEPPYQ